MQALENVWLLFFSWVVKNPVAIADVVEEDKKNFLCFMMFTKWVPDSSGIRKFVSILCP